MTFDQIKFSSLLSIIIFLSSGHSYAGGFDCRATCLGADSALENVVVTKPVEVRVDLSKDQALTVLGEMCEQSLHRMAFLSAAPLLASKFWVTRVNETHSSYDSSTVVYWSWHVWNYAQASTSTIDTYSKFDFGFDPATLDQCHFDRSIPAGTQVPYTGDTDWSG